MNNAKVVNNKLSKIIGIIPARYQSTRFPGKLLQYLHHKTVVQHTYDNASLSNNLDKLFVATDDIRIKTKVQSFGGTALLTPTSCVNGTDRIIYAINTYKELLNSEIIVNIQADHPCTCPATIDAIVSLLKNNDNADMATAVTCSHSIEDANNPNIVKCVFDNNFNALYFSRSTIPYYHEEVAKPNYYFHIGIYAYRTDFLLQKLSSMPTTCLQQIESLEQLKVLEKGFNIKIAIVDEPVLGVDVPEDIAKVEKYLCL
jgi:3-deoxy-manno-octulosonate cytidylyltransferase (CMP-KDO synthetase)